MLINKCFLNTAPPILLRIVFFFFFFPQNQRCWRPNGPRAAVPAAGPLQKRFAGSSNRPSSVSEGDLQRCQPLAKGKGIRLRNKLRITGTNAESGGATGQSLPAPRSPGLLQRPLNRCGTLARTHTPPAPSHPPLPADATVTVVPPSSPQRESAITPVSCSKHPRVPSGLGRGPPLRVFRNPGSQGAEVVAEGLSIGQACGSFSLCPCFNQKSSICVLFIYRILFEKKNSVA